MPVGAREFRGFRRAFRLRVELRQRKIAKHETKLLPEMLLHRLDDGKGSSASGALIVPVLDQGSRGVRFALDEIGWAGRDLQGGHVGFSLALQALHKRHGVGGRAEQEHGIVGRRDAVAHHQWIVIDILALGPFLRHR